MLCRMSECAAQTVLLPRCPDVCRGVFVSFRASSARAEHVAHVRCVRRREEEIEGVLLLLLLFF